MELPTGTVTFLFTDIEGSTRLLQELGEAYRAVQDDQMRLMREAIAEGGGTVIRTEGDAFFAVFPTSTGAVRTAATAERSFAAHHWSHGEPLRIRMGIHTGEGRLGGDDYLGIDVNRAARIAAAGYGGQVLVSETTHALAADALPEGVTLRDLGLHRLKDFQAPQRIYQLVIPDLPSDFPAIRSLEVPTNLPVQLTAFVGRERELAELDALLGQSRLLSLVGPGGTGKTRLALEAARRGMADYRDGVVFVDLSPIRDPDLVPSAILQALEQKEQPGRSALDALKSHLLDERVLLILDNFEQVVPAGPPVTELLQAASGISVMVTSRIRLGVLGEQEYVVPPLDLPMGPSDPEALARNEAVALFRDRARAVLPSFDITSRNADAVAEICIRLGGLPLAIELAAAQLRLFTPAELLARLGHGLPLRTVAANVPERQRTLRGTIEWSFELLEEPPRRLFARLSAFLGGATLATVEAVCNPGGDLRIGTVDGLTARLDHSLVRRLELHEGSRFTMLEPIREYAEERLRTEFDAASTELRHAEFFVAHAERWGPDIRGRDPLTAFAELSGDYENIRGAMDWSLREDRADIGLRIGAAIWRFWVERGPLGEGRSAVEALLQLPSATARDGVRAAGLDALGALAYWDADYGAARRAYTEALDIFRETGESRRSAEALMNLAYAVGASGNPAGAIPLIQEARDLARSVDDQTLTAQAMSFLGIAWRHLGEHELALGALQEALEVFEAVDDVYWANQARSRLGAVYLDMGRLDLAEEFLRRSLADTPFLPGAVGTGATIWILATVAFERGQFERALRLMGFSEGLAERTGSTPPDVLLGDLASHLSAAGAKLGKEAVDRLRAEGAAMSVDEAIAYAMSEQ